MYDNTAYLDRVTIIDKNQWFIGEVAEASIAQDVNRKKKIFVNQHETYEEESSESLNSFGHIEQ